MFGYNKFSQWLNFIFNGVLVITIGATIVYKLLVG